MTPETEEKKYIRNSPIKVVYLDYPLIVQKEVCSFLSESDPNINITTVNTAKELLELLEKNNSFDILLIGMFLQDTTAFELIKEIKFKNINIPFIILDGKDNEDLSVESFRLGASDYITKSDNFLKFLPNSIKRAFLQFKLEKEDNISVHKQEEELLKSQERFRELAENVGVTFWVRDTETNKITYVSPNYELLTELSCQSLYDNMWSWYELVPADDLEVMMNKLKNRDDSVIEFTHRIITPSGKTKWVKTESHPVKNNEGKVIRVVGSVQNITRFKETEDSLLKTSERMNFLITASPAVIYTSTDLINLGPTFVSDNVYQLLGYKSADIISNPDFWFDNTHPDDRDEIFFRAPELYAKELQIYEYRFLHADGTYRWLHSELILLKKEINSDLVEAIAYLIDITPRKTSEIALLKANQQIITIFSNLKEAYFTKDIVKNIFTYFTDSCENVYGYKNTDFYNDPDLWFKTIYQEDLSYIKTFMAKLDQGLTVSFEHRIITSSGEIRWIREKVTPILDSNGILIRIDGIASDINEQKIAEEKLRESQDLFRNSFEHSAIGMSITSLNGKFLQINNSYSKMLGYTKDELLSANFNDITYPDDIDLTINKMRLLIKGSLDSINFEKRYLHQSGAIVWTRVNATLNRDKIGNPLYFITQVENITEQKKANEKLKEQAALLDITTDAITVRDMDDNIIFYNKGAEKLYGYTKSEILEPHFYEVLYKSHKNLLDFDNAKLITVKNGVWHGELEYADKSGKTIIVDSKWTLMKDNIGNPLSILVVNSDITDKKSIQLQLLRAQRLESIGTMASGIAHDLNNILTPILMGTEILKTPVTDDKKLRILNNIERSTRQGVELIKRILMFSRGDEAHFQEINIDELLKEITEIIKDTFSKSINIKVEVDNSISKVMADNTQLNQLFMNLCINARDAMPNGGDLIIKLENVFIDKNFASTHLEAHVGNYVLISVEDTGMGISKETIEKIFEPFFTTKEIGKGTGLGLSTCILIIKNHKGFINVYSEVGKGTTFKIYFPAVTSNENKNTENEVEELAILSGSGELILVVDDEDSIREITKETLEIFGYKVILAADGPEAINLYVKHKEQIRVVLMDINMPLMDGLSTIKALNKIEQDIKIIGMSGLSSNEKLTKNFTDYFLEKPFTTIQLLKLIDEIISTPNISLKYNHSVIQENSQNIVHLEENLLLSEGDRIKSEFLTTISHEIKTPMNGVIGMTNLLRQTALTPEQKEYIGTIEKSENNLLAVINDILDFSKIQSKMVELEKNDFEIKNCLEEVFAAVANEASEKNISLIFDINSEVPKYVKGDINRLKQILSHLVNNALKFIEKGKLFISVELVKKHENILTLKFLVKDTGIGISEPNISKMFQPFTQSDSSNKRKYGGSGLGLALCKKIIELMDGSIWVKSEIGIGSEFHFLINLSVSEKLSVNNGNIIIEEKKDVINISDFAIHYPYKILLAEDNLINQKVAVKLLEKMGYEVDIANNGLEAVNACKTKKYDIIFMDIQMPEMDGLEATKYLLEQDPGNCPRIIALTANAAQNDREFFIKSGMDDFIAKPVSIDKLQSALIKLKKLD